MGLDAMILFFWEWSFKPAFLLFSFTLIKKLFSSSSLSIITVVSSAYINLLMFLPTTLIPVCDSSSSTFHMMYSAYKLNKQGDNITALMYSFPNLELVSCSMSSFNCYFLTFIQISQEAGQVVWYSHLFKNFAQFVIHTVKGFGIVNKTEVDVFLSSCFFQGMLAIWSLVSLSFLNPAWTSGSSQFTYYWSLAWRILSITLLACEMNAIVQ